MTENMIYDTTKQYRAVRDDSPVGFTEQDELIWQAQYYSETSANEDKFERGGYYASPEDAIAGAKRGKATDNFFASLFA